MAMLSMLNELSGELEFRLAVGHFDHKLRETGDVERAMVEKFARGLAVPVYAGSEGVGKLAETSGDSLEEAARKARYRFLNDVANEIDAERIATGHTRSDQVETVLMRVLRGTGVRGLAGIATRRGRIVRPLLCLSDRDTTMYCEALGIPFTVDPTNQDTRFFRNRIRLELLPLLAKEYHAGVYENLLRLARNAQDIVDNVRAKTEPLIQQNLRQVGPAEWILNVAKLGTLDETSMFVLFSDVFGEELECDMDFGRVHYEQVAQLVKDARASGKSLSLPGVTVKKEYENLIITKSQPSASAGIAWVYKTTLTFPGETRAAGVTVTTEILDRTDVADDLAQGSPQAAYCPLDGLKLPLVLRSPVAGDRMRPFGMTGTKKVSDIFTDKKIPGRQRPKSLVVADGDEILWLVGIATSEKCRVDSVTDKVVKITVQEDARSPQET